MIRPTLTLLVLGAGLAGCGEPATPPYANNAAAEQNMVVAAAPVAPKPLKALPAAFQGRWGATPADCKGGAGLATIGATTMSFAGVKATVSNIVQVRDDRVTAQANYANRMGKWQSPTTMTLQDDGKSLAREDTHPSGMFHYVRCAG